tara:strand:- start:20941 stop:21234 length:294 start_codon:yes stop_codon:yes gene_type:complete
MPLELMTSSKKQDDKKLEELLNKKFFCSSKFTQEIERIVQENSNISYIDAILSFCEVNNIELETVPKLISKPLKEKIKYEAMNLNFLKKTSKAKLIF